MLKENPDYFDLFGDVVLEWGYHPGDLMIKTGIYHRYGKDFIVAAGTSLWNSFSGKQYHVKLSKPPFWKKYGAKGMSLIEGDGVTSQLVSSLTLLLARCCLS